VTPRARPEVCRPAQSHFTAPVVFAGALSNELTKGRRAGVLFLPRWHRHDQIRVPPLGRTPRPRRRAGGREPVPPRSRPRLRTRPTFARARARDANVSDASRLKRSLQTSRGNDVRGASFF